ncbi:hypothetical protein [Phenylobacterium sp.]|uniref:hypothetical protein n=1 Tax=Phenylobacterium sp. TaxID=1871053 RepID=UPI0025F3BF0E|nr:hypothetical protein [Phenylobacterium sp.]MBX3482660.1 hypothetical protein [Phenylobacterium sp.]MCW5760198.1 hypothetical protein [Phenylobacterium sp.]
MNARLFALAALIAAAPGLALAQEEPARGHSKVEFMKAYDTDLDGKVSRAEYEAKRHADFVRTDTDRNGVVDEAEYVAEYAARLDAELAAMRKRQIDQARVRFGVIDADKDGRMREPEYDAVAARTFGRLDTNGDGVVDSADTAQSH